MREVPFWFCSPDIIKDDKIKERIGMECSTHGRGGKYTQNVVRYEENIYI